MYFRISPRSLRLIMKSENFERKKDVIKSKVLDFFISLIVAFHNQYITLKMSLYITKNIFVTIAGISILII